MFPENVLEFVPDANFVFYKRPIRIMVIGRIIPIGPTSPILATRGRR
ncbi:MAG: hypothetical protein JWM11_4435 [Planctomycetaceae bacterium]|nr:hypothetical protein [Planctomycetaceae bacterium]